MDVTMKRAPGRTTVMVAASPGERCVRVDVASLADLADRAGRFVQLTLDEVDWLVDALMAARHEAARKTRHVLSTDDGFLAQGRNAKAKARRA